MNSSWFNSESMLFRYWLYHPVLCVITPITKKYMRYNVCLYLNVSGVLSEGILSPGLDKDIWGRLLTH